MAADRSAAACPPEHVLAAFVEQRLAEDELEAIRLHLDDCAGCRRELTEIVRVRSGGSDDLEVLEDAVPDEPPGRYLVLGEHARGGQARIAIAYDRVTGRRVALKEALDSPRHDGRLLREARITAGLDHPGIVAVHDICRRPDGAAFYVMQLLRGRTLAEALARCDSLADRLRLLPSFLALCRTVAFAHDRGVVHRDLKPHNVIVGEFGETTVLDWGLAKAAPVDGAPAGGAADASSTAAAVGTPAYMSPEAAGGASEGDALSDVFGLGAVLYELGTGQRPFAGETVEAVLAAARRGTVRPADQVCPELPRELVTVIHKALAVDKARRYQRAVELADDVESFLTGRRVVVHPYTASELLRRFVRQHRAWASAGALALAALIAALVAVSFALRTARTQRAITASHLAVAQREAAGAALVAGDRVEARLDLVASLASRDSLEARALWWRWREAGPLLWQRQVCDEVWGATFLPDGWQVAVACGNRLVHIVDLLGGTTRVLAGLDDQVTSLAVASDGTRLLGGTEGGRVGSWDLATGAFTDAVRHRGRVFGVGFASDGAELSVGADGWIRIAEPAGGALRREIEVGAAVYSLAVAPDRLRLAVGCADATARVYDIATGELVRSFPGQGGAVGFHPDGRRLASGSFDGQLHLLGIDDGVEQRRFEGHISGPLGVAFSRDGAWLVSVAQDGSARLWRTDGGDSTVLERRDVWVFATAFASDGARFITADLDGNLRLWDGERAQARTATWPDGLGAATAEPTLAGDEVLSIETTGAVRRFDRVTGRLRSSFVTGIATAFRGRALSHDRRSLALASGRDVYIYDLADERRRLLLAGHTADVVSARFSPDDRWLATGGGADHTARVWDTRSGALVHELSGHGNFVWSLAFAGSSLITGCEDHVLRQWSLVTGELERVLGTLAGAINVLDVDPSGRYLIAGDQSGTATWWDVATGAHRVLVDSELRITSIAWSPTAAMVALGWNDGTVQLLDLDAAAGQVRGERRITVHRSEVESVRFSADGAQLVTAAVDGVRLWDVATGEPRWQGIALLTTPPAALTHRGWQAPDGSPIESPAPGSRWSRMLAADARVAVASIDGRALCVATRDSGVELWDPARDERIARHDAPRADQLVAQTSGCLIRSGSAAWLLRADGALLPVSDAATAIGEGAGDAGGWLLATHDGVQALDRDGRASAPTTALGAGASALATGPRGLLVGFADGRVVGAAGPGGASVTMAHAVSSPVTVLRAGPARTVIAGFRSGVIAIWSQATGALLHRTAIHGSVSAIAIAGDHLNSLSETGDTDAWSVALLTRSYCAVMREIMEGLPDVDERRPPACAD